MRDITEIQSLLDELEHLPASELEDQDLDFKEWNFRSMADSVDLVVEMAICIANGGGGTVDRKIQLTPNRQIKMTPKIL